MEFTKKPFGWWCGVVVKCLLSCLSVLVLMILLDWMRVWYAIHPVKRRIGGETPVPVASDFNPGRSAQDEDVFWPQFSGSDHAPVHRATINGVLIMNQSWDTHASGRDAIDFYRQQMLARGWQDVTEQTLEFRPELQASEGYMRMYQATLDSDLILRRNDWSMQVKATPSQQTSRQTTISICAGSTPSFNDFFQQLASGSGNNSSKTAQPLEVVQESANEVYHTSIAEKDEPPAQAFQETLAEYGTKGWQQALAEPQRTKTSGYFAWLVKGEQYAALSVGASSHGGASVTFVEVSPK